MKASMFTSTLIVFVFFSLGTFGAGLRSRHAGGAGPASCPSATVVKTSTVSVNGVNVTRTTLECPEQIAVANTASTPELVKRLTPSNILEARNPTECKTSAPECQCGVVAVCGCSNSTLIKETPNPNDCEILVQSMSVIQQLEPTFVVQSGQMEEVSFQSCGLFFVNNGLTRKPIEFCWDEFATWGSLGNEGCFDTNKGVELECLSDNLEWQIQGIRVDSLDN